MRHPLGTTSVGVLKTPAGDEENSLAKCGDRLLMGDGEALAITSGGPGFAKKKKKKKGPKRDQSRVAEGSLCPQLSKGRDTSELPLWLNWEGKEAAEEGERGSCYGASWSLIGKGKAESQKRLLIDFLCVCTW